MRGESGLVNSLARKSRFAKRPSCSLVTGHHGSGKSTELRRLQGNLGNEQEKYFTVFCDIRLDVDILDLDYPNLLISMIGQLAQQIRQRLRIELGPGYFRDRFQELKEILTSEVDFESLTLKKGLLKATAAIKSSPSTRKMMRKLLEPRTDQWIFSANSVIGDAVVELRKLDYQGLVIVIDGLDKLTAMRHK